MTRDDVPEYIDGIYQGLKERKALADALEGVFAAAPNDFEAFTAALAAVASAWFTREKTPIEFLVGVVNVAAAILVMHYDDSIEDCPVLTSLLPTTLRELVDMDVVMSLVENSVFERPETDTSPLN